MSWPAFWYPRLLAAVLTLAAFATASVAARTDAADDPKSPPAHQALLKDAKSTTGLLPVHQKGTNLYLELGSSEYDNEYIVLISIAKGIGQTPLLGGYSWGFGDDWVWTFRKIDDKVHVIRKNVRFRASKRHAGSDRGRQRIHGQHRVQPADRRPGAQGRRPCRFLADLHE